MLSKLRIVDSGRPKMAEGSRKYGKGDPEIRDKVHFSSGWEGTEQCSPTNLSWLFWRLALFCQSFSRKEFLGLK